MKLKNDDWMAAYCNQCGFVDVHISKNAVKCIQRFTQDEDALITCKQCGAKIKVNLKDDLMDINKQGKIKLKETSKW